ncbi:hypothetical protein [Pontibacter flavimaris]
MISFMLTKKSVVGRLAGGLLLLCSSFTSLAQQAPGAQRVQALLTDEQVRLVHSQPYYAAGERLWFKAFLNKSTSSAHPSKALYVELLDAQEQLILRQRLIIEEGTSYGDILLPENLPSGNYTLLATTNWMRNYSKGQQYREQLLIVNAGEVMALQGKTARETARPLHVQFFPESNNLLAGVASRVAVVATNAAGMGVAASCTILSSAGDTVVSFQTDKTGVGSFRLRPGLQEQYEAQVQADGYTLQRTKLPAAKQVGLALVVEEQQNEELRVRINNSGAWAYTLLAEAGGKVYFSQQGSESGVVAVPWPAEAGETVRLLLLNPGGAVEAEQKVVRRQEQVALRISTDRKQYGPRQQVTVNVQVENRAGAPVAANVAVATTSINQDFHRPLPTATFTWSEEGQGEQALVHTPDKELWNGLMRGEAAAKYKPELLVDAFAREGVTEPYSNAAYSAPTDTAFVQSLPESMVNYAKQHHNRTRISEAYGVAEPHATAPIPKLPADRVFRLDDYVTFHSVEEAIREATTNLRLSKRKGRYEVRLLYVRPGVKKMLKQEPIYLVDGVVVNGMEEILALNLNDIASFELTWLEEKLYAGNLGNRAENGMFAVYTKSGEAREKLKEKGYPVLYEQYTRPKSFVPASAGAEGMTTVPDLRQLVHWEPQLQVGVDGKASFTFYTSDETGEFTIRIAGQTAAGEPLHGEATYEVSLME